MASALYQTYGGGEGVRESKGTAAEYQDGETMVEYVDIQNTKTGSITHVIIGNAIDGTEASYTDLTIGTKNSQSGNQISQSINGQKNQNGDEFRKNGGVYQYNGGVVQNWTNETGDRYAEFTDQSGRITKFPGASITDFLIIEGTGYTTDNGSIHADKSFTLALFQHEYDHYLQALYIGSNYYNTQIIPSSFYSGISSGNDYMKHQNFWTEKDASARAVKFFGSASAIGHDRYQPTGISFYIEMLGYAHRNGPF